MGVTLPRLLLELPAPDPILAETVQLRAELHAARRQLAARDAQLERTYAQLVTLRAQLAALGRDTDLAVQLAGQLLMDMEGPVVRG